MNKTLETDRDDIRMICIGHNLIELAQIKNRYYKSSRYNFSVIWNNYSVCHCYCCDTGVCIINYFFYDFVLILRKDQCTYSLLPKSLVFNITMFN